MCRDYDSLCRDYDSSLPPSINASAMVSPGTRSTASNQYHVPGMEYIIGTLILRSFRVLEEVSSTSTADTAEYVSDSWYGVCNGYSDTSELRST